MEKPRWLKTLVASGEIDLKRIRSKPFRDIASLIGTEATVSLFVGMHGDFIKVGCEYIYDLEKEYCRLFSADKTETELARILGRSRSKIHEYMSRPQKKYEYIPMFPEYD
jgi:hypothetical protein